MCLFHLPGYIELVRAFLDAVSAPGAFVRPLVLSKLTVGGPRPITKAEKSASIDQFEYVTDIDVLGAWHAVFAGRAELLAQPVELLGLARQFPSIVIGQRRKGLRCQVFLDVAGLREAGDRAGNARVIQYEPQGKLL